MFSPSLLTAIVHSYYWEQSGKPDDVSLVVADASQWTDLLRQHIHALPDDLKWDIRIPVVGCVANHEVLKGTVRECAMTSRLDGEGSEFVCGRIPLQALSDQMIEPQNRTSDVEYLDLATAIDPCAAVVGQPVEDACRYWLRHTAQLGTEVVRVVVVDTGDYFRGARPDDFDGHLTHLIDADIVMSPHALKVLWVLLERLERLNILHRTAIFCSLIRKPDPDNMIGLECFKHAGIVEVGEAFRALDRLVVSGGKPLVTNLSVGTHVGPHNGESPLEQLLRLKFRVKNERYLVAAAGNDGLRGVTARREIIGNVREFLRVVAGGLDSRELLMEFWWEQAGPSTVSISVRPRFANQQPVCQPISIDANTAGAIMSAQGPYRRSFVLQSLCHAKCHGDMHCIAFGISAGPDRSLNGMYFDIELQSTVDVVINAWIVVSTDKTTAFSMGSAEGTITVPATESSVLSVAGASQDGPWAESSRGPVGVYASLSSASSSDQAPLIAHDPYAHGEHATSFAAPKATADVAKLVMNVQIRQNLTGSAMLASELLKSALPNVTGSTRKREDNRTGYGTLPD
jgi:hypothetical protein